MSTELPQVCVKCRKLKVAHLGEFFKSRSRYNRRYWICSQCLEEPKVERLARHQHPSSPIEEEVSKRLAPCGYKVFQEYKLGKFIYDFAVPRLRLLIEVDSYSYHKSKRQLRRDLLKSKSAKAEHWCLVRITPPDTGLKAQLEVEKRAKEVS